MAESVQKHIRCRRGDVAEYVLIPGDPQRAERIAQRLTDARLISVNREYTVFTGTYEGVPVSVCSTGIGGPSTAIAMEELTRVGASTFIRVGSCGARRDGIEIGEPVIVNAAVRAGGTASAYLPDIFPAVASLDVVNAMQQAARDQVPYWHVPEPGCLLPAESSPERYAAGCEGCCRFRNGMRHGVCGW